jgi:hypothetical protein
MASGRRQHNLTVLADGSVLATGGNSSGASLVDLANGVYPAEVWDPDTGNWRTLASMQVTRQYHSIALLLPDGRVLSAGGGICGTCDQVGYLAKNAEVFSPPYLFKKDGSGELAPRPEVTSAPDEATYDSHFSFSVRSAASIEKVALVRLGAVTHSVNMEQRHVPLSFTADGETIDALAPANPNIAPPGVYMLFATSSDGVPSVARMMRVGTEPTTAITAGPRAGTNDPTPTFSLSSQPGATFECRLSGSYAPCSSPATTSYLDDGSHTFSVRAVDQAGEVDPTPASRSFTVRTAEVEVSSSALVVRGAPGAKDHFEITRPSPSTLRVTDAAWGPYRGSGIRAGPGCARHADAVDCDRAGVTRIRVYSHDQIDKVVNGTAVKSSLSGGAADDVLVGGSGNDNLRGGAGADVFRGRNGNDELFARDLASDTRMNCDGGASPGNADGAELDLLPDDSELAVVNCEIRTRR